VLKNDDILQIIREKTLVSADAALSAAVAGNYDIISYLTNLLDSRNGSRIEFFWH
jgi:hypothetical protein